MARGFHRDRMGRELRRGALEELTNAGLVSCVFQL